MGRDEAENVTPSRRRPGPGRTSRCPPSRLPPPPSGSAPRPSASPRAGRSRRGAVLHRAPGAVALAGVVHGVDRASVLSGTSSIAPSSSTRWRDENGSITRTSICRAPTSCVRASTTGWAMVTTRRSSPSDRSSGSYTRTLGGVPRGLVPGRSRPVHIATASTRIRLVVPAPFGDTVEEMEPADQAAAVGPPPPRTRRTGRATRSSCSRCSGSKPSRSSARARRAARRAVKLRGADTGAGQGRCGRVRGG